MNQQTNELNGDILKLYILYLEKIDSLNGDERKAYQQYFTHLNNPPIIISGEDLLEDIKTRP